MNAQILLGGGAFRGAVQIPVLTWLRRTLGLQPIAGVSVGAVNGVMAAQDRLGELERIWCGLDDRAELDGVRGFLRPALGGVPGLYSLDPLRDQVVERRVTADRLVVDFAAGWVEQPSAAYRQVLWGPGRLVDIELVDGVLASSAMAAIMEPVTIRGVPCFDGGHRHVVPLAPDPRSPIHAVFCAPLEPVRPHATLHGLFGAIAWAAEQAYRAAARGDLARLQAAADCGAEVWVYEPGEDVGGLLDASRPTIERRFGIGERMIAGRRRL